MMGRTHMLLGINLLWLLEITPFAFGPLNDPGSLALAAIGAAVGALLPDLDASTSLLQKASVAGIRPLALPGRYANRRFGHRGFPHSFLALGLWSTASLPIAWVSVWLWLGLSLGYLSHLLGDACTRSGLRLLYPDRRVVHLLPRPLRLSTGSPAEEAVFALLGAGALCLLLRHLFLFG